MQLVCAGELTTSAAAAPTQAMWVGIVVSALAGYGALGFMLALICAYGATAAEMVKTMRKVLQVRPCQPNVTESSCRLTVGFVGVQALV